MQRGGPKLQRFSTKQTTTATVICPRFCPASKRERQGRNITENEHGSSKHATSPATVRKTYPNNLPPVAFHSLTDAATAATTRDSASLLSNKRVRGVVHGETMHLRPRVSTYSAVTKNPCRYRHRHIGTFCLQQSAQRENRFRGD